MSLQLMPDPDTAGAVSLGFMNRIIRARASNRSLLAEGEAECHEVTGWFL